MDILFIFVLGTIVGSFVGLSAYRIPRGLSVIFPQSHCPHCHALLSVRELIPVVSWIFLSGKCRHCQSRISGYDLAAEIICGVLFVMAYHKIGMEISLLPIFVLIYFLLLVACIDYEHFLILDKVMVAMFAMCIILHIFNFFIVTGDDEIFYYLPVDWLDGVYGFLLGGGLMFLLFLLSGAMGFGDVWFTAVMGLWLGTANILLTIFLSFCIGGLIGALLILLQMKGRKEYIAFGPFLAVAGFISSLYGADFLRFYQGLSW